MYLSLRCQFVHSPKEFAQQGVTNLQSKPADLASSWTAKHSEVLSDLTVYMLTTFRWNMVGRGGLEPPTSRLSGVRSNHLSYRPG